MTTAGPELELPLYEGEEINLERMTVQELRSQDIAAELDAIVPTGEVVDVDDLRSQLNSLMPQEVAEVERIWTMTSSLCIDGKPAPLSDLNQRGLEVVKALVELSKTRTDESFAKQFADMPGPFQVELVGWALHDQDLKFNSNVSMPTVRRGVTTVILADNLDVITSLYADYADCLSHRVEIVKALNGDRSAFHGAMGAAYALYGGKSRGGRNAWAVRNLATAISLGIMPVGEGDESTEIAPFDWSKFASEHGYTSQKAMRDDVEAFVISTDMVIDQGLSLKKMPPALLREFVETPAPKRAVLVADSKATESQWNLPAVAHSELAQDLMDAEEEEALIPPEEDALTDADMARHAADVPLKHAPVDNDFDSEPPALAIVDDLPDDGTHTLEASPPLTIEQIAAELDLGFKNLMIEAGRFGDELFRLQQLAMSIDPTAHTTNTTESN